VGATLVALREEANVTVNPDFFAKTDVIFNPDFAVKTDVTDDPDFVKKDDAIVIYQLQKIDDEHFLHTAASADSTSSTF